MGGGARQADTALPAVGLQEQAENFWALVEGKGSGRVARVWPLGVPCSCSLAWPFHQSTMLGSPLAPPALCTPCPCSGQIVRDHLLLEVLAGDSGVQGVWVPMTLGVVAQRGHPEDLQAQGHLSVHPQYTGLCSTVGRLLFPPNAALLGCHFGGVLRRAGRLGETAGMGDCKGSRWGSDPDHALWVLNRSRVRGVRAGKQAQAAKWCWVP